MKLLIDMNLSPAWVGFLAGAGLEAVHWSQLGRADASDSEIMAYARANDLVVLTHDLDFSAILAATHGDKPSVVQIRADSLDIGYLGANVISAVLQMRAYLDEGALLTIDPKRFRLRVLPLRAKS